MTFVARTLSPWNPVILDKNALAGSNANFYDKDTGLTRSLSEGNPVTIGQQTAAVEVPA